MTKTIIKATDVNHTVLAKVIVEDNTEFFHSEVVAKIQKVFDIHYINVFTKVVDN